MMLADRANQYIDEKKPWALMKNSNHTQQVQTVCTMGINLFRILMIYLKPVLPETAKHVEALLRIEPLQWHNKDKPLLNHQINEFKPLIQRIDPKQIEAMKMAAQEDIAQSTTNTTPTPAKEYISIDDFNKIDLRVAKVLEADHVEGADKLLRLKVDLGNETRQIFAGIKSAFQPEQLVGKNVVVVANLEPRKMRFGISEGMVIVANSGEQLYLVSPDENTPAGSKVK